MEFGRRKPGQTPGFCATLGLGGFSHGLSHGMPFCCITWVRSAFAVAFACICMHLLGWILDAFERRISTVCWIREHAATWDDIYSVIIHDGFRLFTMGSDCSEMICWEIPTPSQRSRLVPFWGFHPHFVSTLFVLMEPVKIRRC